MTQARSLPTSTPEAQGIPSAAISAFVSAAARDLDTLHSFMLLRHGYVVAEGWWEPYRRDDLHLLFSLSKSFTATAIGLLMDEGQLAVDDLVLDFFPEAAPSAPSANLRAMRVRHLLSMSTGHDTEPLLDQSAPVGRTWVERFLAHPVVHEPGSHFLYNSLATYMLSAIVQKLTGGRMIAYLQPRLFAPLGISRATWETSPEGIDTGGWGLSITTDDIAAFGQLYLQKGRWKGERLLSATQVAEATSCQVSNGPAPTPDWEQGYGYQFWRCRHNAYRGDGAFGQFCVVMPDQDAVVAITAGLGDMQPVLDLIWQQLLPAMGTATLPEDSAAQKELTDQLAGLQLRRPPGHAPPPIAARVSGQQYTLAENETGFETIRFDFGAAESVIHLGNGRGVQQIVCGQERWLRDAVGLPPLAVQVRLSGPEHPEPWKIAASGAWVDEQTYIAKLWWYETPFARTLTCRFVEGRLEIAQTANVGFGPTEGPSLQGWPA